MQSKLSLSEGMLGLILLGLSVGVLTALSIAGGLIARFGSRTVTLVGAVGLCLTLPLLALAPSPIALWAALCLFGGSMSVMDVAMNEQAVLVERNAGRPMMSSFHASFSIGGLVGALIGVAMASQATLSPVYHFVLVSVMFGVAIILAAPHLLRVKPEPQEKQAVFRLPKRALWPLGAVAFATAIGEGAMADWGAVFLTQVLETTAAFAALGFAAFSLTMTIGRLLGDKLSARWSPVLIVRVGGLAATIGVLAAAISAEPIVVLIGFAAVGIGLANIIPLAFSAGGNFPGIATGVGIASVATIGYAGFLAGPPIIGLIAEATSLRVAFVIVALLIGSLVFTASAITPTTDGVTAAVSE